MPQVPLALGQLGDPSMSTRSRKGGDTVHVARAKGRRLDGKRVQVEASGSSPTAARRALAAAWETRRTQRDGQVVPAPASTATMVSSARLTPTSTVADVLRAWLDDEETSPRTRPQSVERYEGTVRVHLIPALGELGLHEVSADTITQYLREKRAGATPSAVESSMKVLKKMVAFAHRRGILSADILAAVEIPPAVQTRTIAIATPAQVRDILEICDDYSPTLGLVMRVVAETGARLGEVLALHADALHPDDGPTPYIDLHGTVVTRRGGTVRQAENKTSASRRGVAVTPGTMARLRLAAATARREWPDPEPVTGLYPIFPTRTGGWTAEATLGAWRRKAMAAADRPDLAFITAKTFRATLATAIAAQRGDQSAADQLGHARVSVTGRHYIAAGELVRGAGPEALTEFLREA